MDDSYRWYNPLSSPFAETFRIAPPAPAGDRPENAIGMYPARLVVSIKEENDVELLGFFETPSDINTTRTIRLRTVFRYNDSSAPEPDRRVFSVTSTSMLIFYAAAGGVEIQFDAPRKPNASSSRDLNIIVDSGASCVLSRGVFDRVYVLLIGADTPRVTIDAKARIRDTMHLFTTSGVRNASATIADYAKSFPAQRICGAITTHTVQTGWSADNAWPIQLYTDTGRGEDAALVRSRVRIARFRSIESLGEFFATHASRAHAIVRPLLSVDFDYNVLIARARQPAVETRDLIIPSDEGVPVDAVMPYKSGAYYTVD